MYEYFLNKNNVAYFTKTFTWSVYPNAFVFTQGWAIHRFLDLHYHLNSITQPINPINAKKNIDTSISVFTMMMSCALI